MGAATRAAAVLVVAVVFAAGAAARQIDDDAGPNRNLLQQRLDCTRVHRACSVCRSQRIKGSLKTELVCSQCRSECCGKRLDRKAALAAHLPTLCRLRHACRRLEAPQGRLRQDLR